MNQRIEWIDQVKGFGIFLVIYGHNFPIIEKYIYSFHMPLFFLISGFFHPTIQNKLIIVKRFKTLVLPYFIWAIILFLFWSILGRHFGESSLNNLSFAKNFIGIFYAQGDMEYMDWGIPMWFLPTLFLSFLLFYIIRLINVFYLQILLLIFVILVGFLLPKLFKIRFLWSMDVGMAALVFYSIGFYFKEIINSLKPFKTILLFSVFGLLHFLFYNVNGGVDMYRSIYSNEFLFVLNGLLGALYLIFFFKILPVFKIFEVMGKFTIPFLAMHLRALTFIKLILWVCLSLTVFNFSESQKVFVSIVQVILIFPIAFLINKYFPVLNGGYKKT